MGDFWQWYDAAKARAEATEAGKAFLAAGFRFCTTGGGCTAWRLDLPDGREILATDRSGTSVEPDDGWLLGVCDADGAEEEIHDFATDDLAGLFAKAEELKTAPVAREVGQ